MSDGAWMTSQPWFKLWSTDYLCDPKVDALPLEAQGFLIRMWCVCNQRGSIPDDPEEIARLTQSRLQSCLLNYPLCKPFFVLREGQLFSRRMETEKEKSRIARENASKRCKTDLLANGYASGSPNGSTQKARRSESKKTREQESIPQAKTLAVTASAVPAGDSPVFITLPLNDQTEFTIQERQVVAWKELYPAVDVRQEIRKYKGWADANPRKRKTRRGILASVNSWLAKEQDKFKLIGEPNGANRSHGHLYAKQERTRAAIERAAKAR
jgi:hypothetical protein